MNPRFRSGAMRWIIQTAAVALLVACALLPGERGSVRAQELDLGAAPPIEQAQTLLQRGEWARAIPMLEQALLRDLTSLTVIFNHSLFRISNSSNDEKYKSH